MQRIPYSLIVPTLVAVIAVVAGATATWLRADSPAAQAAAGFAVLELFTSEGCSSCPSADAALAEVLHRSQDKPVYTLAFHVDYWDGLGWPDRFAAKAYTERQSRYAASLKTNNVYTPQAIVNGSREVVGSNRKLLDAAIAEAIATPAAGTITATATRLDGGVQLAITSTNLGGATLINAAIVEDGLTSDVRRGENRGKTLPHEHVVRAFQTFSVDDRGVASPTLLIPSEVRVDHSTIILYAQRACDLQVLAATEVHLPK